MANEHHRDPERDYYLIGLLVLCTLVLVVLAPRLVVPDLIIDYPHMGGDSQDWIANGLHLFGFDVRYSVRPPLLPLAIGLTDRLSILELLPVGLLILQLTAAVLLYLWLRDRHSRPLALAVAVAILANYSWLGLGMELMADVPAACLLFAGAWCFVRALNRDPVWYLPAGVMVGLSAVTQQLALLFPIAAAATLVVHRRDHLRDRWLWAGALIFALPYALWTGHKLLAFGTAGDVMMRNWSLLALHVDTIGSDALTTASLLSLPGAVLAAVGVVLLASGARRRPSDLLVVALLVVIVVFFVLLYRYHSKRLLVYIFPLSGIAIAELLARLRWRGLRWGVTGVYVATSLMPLPAPASSHRWIAAWPLPPLELHSLSRNEAGRAGVDPGTVRLERLQLAELARWFIPDRAEGPGSETPTRAGLDYRPFLADDSAVWLHDGEVSPRGRYQIGLRLGNVLRKRVKHLSLDTVAPFLGGLEAEPAAMFEDLTIYRVRLIGSDGSWLMAVARDGVAADLLATKSPEATAEVAAGTVTASRIAAMVGRLPVVVVTGDADPEPSLLSLSFLARSPEFFVLSRERYRRNAEAFDAGPASRLGLVGDATVSVVEAAGRPWAVVAYR